MNNTAIETFKNNLVYILGREYNEGINTLLIDYNIDFEDGDTILESLNELTNEAIYCIFEKVYEFLNGGDSTNEVQTGRELGYNRAILDFKLIIGKTNAKIK